MLLAASLAGVHTEVSLTYRKDFIGDFFAQDFALILQAAIGYLLNANNNSMPISTKSQQLSNNQNTPQDCISLTPAVSEDGYRPLHEAFFNYTVGVDEDSAIAFWQNQFTGLEAQQFPALPSASYRPQVNNRLTQSIDVIDRRGEEFTPSTVIRAACAILLAAYTDSSEAIFGARVAERQAAAANGEPMASREQISGPSVATVPIHISVDRENSVEQLLQQVQSQAVEMTAFEQMGLHRIRRVSPEAERGSQFQTLLVVQPAEEDSEVENELFRSTRTNVDDAKALSAFNTYAMMLECQIKEQGLQLNISFDSAVVPKKQIERMMQQLENVLRQLRSPEHAQTKLANVETVSEQDLQEIWGWNARVPEAVEACVHDLIAETTRRQPEAPAVCAWDGELTYGELDRLSARLAHHLVGLGVGPEVIVPLCFEKSMWTPVAQLAVIKAGGASFAMDSGQPEERLRMMVQQIKPRLILSSSNNRGLASRLTQHRVVVVDETHLQDLEVFMDQKLPAVSPSNMLYLVFTSGSTGIPKGAIVTHQNFCSAIKHQNRAIGISSSSRVYDFVSYAFDVSWSNLLHTFAAGGCLCVPSQTDREQDISGSIRTLQANFAHLTPTVTRFLQHPNIPSLKTLHLSGELLKASLAVEWVDKVKVINSYGPAECAVTGTLDEVRLSAGNEPNIGRGVGACPWVIDKNLGSTILPPGSVGELWLEGPLVGQGYLNDPEKTAAAFVDDPSWLLRGGPGHPGRRGRLYKTGDLVRYNPDGTLMFIGRKDAQVKIRGQRVELGEVEHHVRCSLEEVENITQVVAEVLTPQGSDNPTLVAFLGVETKAIATSEDDLKVAVQRTTAGLEEKLVEALPAYMIPSAYIPLTSLPVTTTGKTDRRRLREMGETLYWDQVTADSQRGRILPADSLQESIQDVWVEVLNLPGESISMDSAFTRLGGDSITAMQVVSRCRARNISTTVGDVLRLQTIQKLSARCKPVVAAPVIADEEPEGSTWALSPIQQRYFDAHPQGLNHFNQSFLLKLTNTVSTAAVGAALQALVTRHPMLRARFHQNGEGTWKQFIIPNGSQAFSLAEYFLERRAEVHRIAQNRQESLNISEGPVFAADLFNIKDEAQALLLSAHHLVVDLVSWRIIWHDITQCLTSGALLLQKTVSFQTWCKLQQERSQALSPAQVLPFAVEAPQVEYWGISRQDNFYGDCQQYSECTDNETTALLLGRSNTSFRTEPVDILLATLIHSFRQTFPDRNTPPVFLEGHGREPMDGIELDLSETVGWFTTLHPLQVSSSVENTIFDTVRAVKDLRRQVPGKGQPYFAFRYYSTAGREEFKNHSAVELLFNYTGIYQQLESKDSLFEREDRPGLTTDLIEVSPGARRMALIAASVGIEQGQTSISLQVNSRMAHQTQLQRWAALWGSSLEAATRSLADSPASFTLSDFALLSISYAGLESLIGIQLASLGIAVDDVQDIYPCTPLQEGVILSKQKGMATYANYWVWQCVPTSPGEKVSPHQLEAAWRSTAGRHTILSTIFANHPESGSFVQVQLRDPAPRVAYIDSGRKPPADALQKIDRTSFSAGSPEYALTICQASSSGEVACRLDMSHALFDAASTPILARDLARAYGGEILPAAPSFREVVQYLKLTPRSIRLAYWKTYLANVKVCELPSVQPSVQVQNQLECQYGEVEIPVSVTSGVDQFCRHRHITRSVFLQVAWAMVLSQYTGMREACFGYLASGRDAPIDNIEELVGPLISILISRVDLDRPLDEVTTTTHEHSIEHLAYQHTSLAEVQHELSLGGQRLFNTAVTVREAHRYSSNITEEIQLRDAGGEDPHEVRLRGSLSW